MLDATSVANYSKQEIQRVKETIFCLEPKLCKLICDDIQDHLTWWHEKESN